MDTTKIKRENVSWKRFIVSSIVILAVLMAMTVWLAPKVEASTPATTHASAPVAAPGTTTCIGNVGACGPVPPPQADLSGEDALCAGSAAVAGVASYYTAGGTWGAFVMAAAGYGQCALYTNFG